MSSELLVLFEESNRFHAPLGDPLHSDLVLHQWLSGKHEIVYSEWLLWALGQIDSPELICKLLQMQPKWLDPGMRIAIEREVWVPHGREGATGRLDLCITQANRCLCIIEVKTRDFTCEDLEKHPGYQASQNADDCIFLALKSAADDPGEFRFLAWADLCIGMRRAAQNVKQRKGLITAAFFLAFVGAVEQNLLGFKSPLDAPPLAIIPALTEHLKRSLMEDF